MVHHRTFFQVYQCRPDYRQQIIGKHAAKQSVCRQCFNPCDPSDTNDGGRFCFGGAHQKNQHKLFMANLKLNENSYPWGGFYGQTNEQALGIPIARCVKMFKTQFSLTKTLRIAGI